MGQGSKKTSMPNVIRYLLRAIAAVPEVPACKKKRVQHVQHVRRLPPLHYLLPESRRITATVSQESVPFPATSMHQKNRGKKRLLGGSKSTTEKQKTNKTYQYSLNLYLAQEEKRHPNTGESTNMVHRASRPRKRQCFSRSYLFYEHRDSEIAQRDCCKW